MDFDLTWALWALPLAFAAGWLASRFDVRQWRLESRSAPKTYFKGLNYLLNEQQDEAIDAFIAAVQQDPDTSELHFALGNLFRRRGDYDRAVRVHQHLLQRGDLSKVDHERAQHALAMDFIKAGLLDRAEDSLQKLMGTSYQEEAQVALLGLYERSREWAKAIPIARMLESSGRGSFKSRIAHYLCELAQESSHRQEFEIAQTQLNHAQEECPESARARLAMANLHEQAGRTQAAFDQLVTLANMTPGALPLAATKLATLAVVLGKEPIARKLLMQAEAQSPSVDFVEALAALSSPDEEAGLYLAHLRREPSMVAAAGWITHTAKANTAKAENQDLGSGANGLWPPEVMKAVNKAVLPLRRYRCAACGFEAGTHFWQCPGCQTWDSYSPRRVDEL